MSDLDGISYEIGQLRSTVDLLVSESRAHDTRARRVEEAVNNINLTLLANVADVAIMKPHVSHYASVRRYAGAALACLVTAAGLGGGLIQHYIEKKWL